MHSEKALAFMFFLPILLTFAMLSDTNGYMHALFADYAEEARLSTGIVGDTYASSPVAISGNTAVVSSNAGFHVYLRTGSVWAETALIPSDGLGVFPTARFVAISGDTIVIGGPLATIGSNAEQGAAYVFTRSGTTWTQQQRLTASDGSANDQFGFAVSIRGESIIAGVRRDDVGSNVDQGSAYVFVRQDGVWSEQAKLVANDGGADNLFGGPVAIWGDTAVVSRSRSSSATIPDPATYVFVRSGSTWSQQQRLSVCEPSAFDLCSFGISVAVDGDTLAVGNPMLNIGSNIAQGGVYVYSRTGTTWTQQQRLLADDGQADSTLGRSLGLDGNKLVIGAHAGNVRPGSAYLFDRIGGTWTFRQKIQIADATESNWFGIYVSMDADRFIVAAPRDNQNFNGPIGAAYVFASPGVGPTPTPAATPTPSPSPTPILSVSVSGRVTTPGGLGLRNAVVSLTNSLGLRQTATTSSFGIYSFQNITPGENYVIGVSSKRYRFAALSMTINDNMTNVDFVGLE
jgi:hypothetical protein